MGGQCAQVPAGQGPHTHPTLLCTQPGRKGRPRKKRGRRRHSGEVPDVGGVSWAQPEGTVRSTGGGMAGADASAERWFPQPPAC